MPDILVVENKVELPHLREIAQQRFGDMVKAVIDIELRIMAVGGELHADEEAMLLARGSKQDNLWGINIYIDQPKDSWIEFDSMINLRPSQNNHSRFVENLEIRNKITKIVNKLII